MILIKNFDLSTLTYQWYHRKSTDEGLAYKKWNVVELCVPKPHVSIQNLLKNNSKLRRHNCSTHFLMGGTPTPAYHYNLIQETLQDLFHLYWISKNVNAILCFPKKLHFFFLNKKASMLCFGILIQKKKFPVSKSMFLIF